MDTINHVWVFAAAFVLARFVFTQATVIFDHPEDVTVEPNVWANFSCTVHCSLSPVKWYKVDHPYPIDYPTVTSIDGLKFIEPSNSTCTSEHKTIYFLDVLATKQIHNSAFYCAVYETCQRCQQTECKCGCDRCYSRPALLRVVETEDTLTTPSQTSSMASNAQTNFPETISTTIKVTVTPSPTNSPIAGIKLAETIATSASISLPFIIIATAIVLVMVCGFIYRKNTPDEKSVEKASKAMVPSPVYEEPQCKIVQPELNTLENPHQTADAVASIDNPFYQAVPTNEGTAVAEASEPSQGSLEGSMPLTGTDLSNNNYIVMHPIGTLGTLV